VRSSAQSVSLGICHMRSLLDTNVAVSTVRVRNVQPVHNQHVLVRCLSTTRPDTVLVLTFSVPMNSRCSTACATPGMSFGSLKLPTLTSKAALDLSVLGSCMRRTSSSLGSVTILYDRSSSAGRSKSSSLFVVMFCDSRMFVVCLAG
jgi:hypothetical protein